MISPTICPNGHAAEYRYYGGTSGYTYCAEEDKWWEINMGMDPREVDGPYARDLLTDFVEGNW